MMAGWIDDRYVVCCEFSTTKKLMTDCETSGSASDDHHFVAISRAIEVNVRCH